ncbi:MAG: tetraacyldisaccharide 4'-kinase [Planctomycetes bacterium]|nr:tetraacyldisaccharide 4'-kinase [Planctomycetota bacterium]
MNLSRLESLLDSRSRFVRGLLAASSCVYCAGQWMDARRTEARLRRGVWPERLPVPVISLGNIVAGGVGKTPLVEAIARAAIARGRRPGILSRGYRAKSGQRNDEALLLERRLDAVPHIQDPNRCRGGRALLERFPDVDLILLDDGFQHRRLHRDVDLVVLDATRPFGLGHLLPRGRLREPWRALDRATGFVVTRREDVSKHKGVILDTLLRQHWSTKQLHFARTVIEGVRDLSGGDAKVPGRRVFAFAGVGNPHAFYGTVRRFDLDVVGSRSFPDHHRYRRRDWSELTEVARRSGASALICTEKDGVKLEPLLRGGPIEVPLLQLRMRFELDAGAILDDLDVRRERESARHRAPSGHNSRRDA